MSDDVDRVNQDIDWARTTYLTLARMTLVTTYLYASSNTRTLILTLLYFFL